MGRNISLSVPSSCLPPQEQDYLLATEALRGNPHAWDTLYLDSVSFVVNAARKYDVQKWFSPSDYPDIADEAFAKCYEHLERYRGLGRFRNWVLGYAKNIMRNRWRKQHTVRRNQSLLEGLATSQLRHLDPLILLIRLERSRYLWDAFHRLTALEQRIMYQCVFCGTPPRTIARAFQLTRKQVLQHYEDARVKLRWNYLRLYR